MRARIPRARVPRGLSLDRIGTKRALMIALCIGVVTSVTVGSVLAAFSSDVTNPGSSVAAGTFTLNDYANYATTTLTAAITSTGQSSIQVQNGSLFPPAGNFTIQIGGEQMLVTGGQGTNTWNVTRAVNGTTLLTPPTPIGTTVSTAPCSTIGFGASSDINTTCDGVLGYSASTENYPGTPVTATVRIQDSGSLGATDLAMWMPSCLRGVTPDASWAANTTTVSSYSGASTSGGNLAGGTTYYYEITAVIGGTEQVAGTETSYTPPGIGTTNQITLNWTTIATATAYKIYRSTTEGQEQFLATVSGGTSHTYADTSNTSPSGYPPEVAGSGNPCQLEPITTLNGALTAGATSLTVSGNSEFPTDPNGNYRILVYDVSGCAGTPPCNLEYMTVTAGQGTNTWTVTRGVGGSSATAKLNGDPVVLLDDAGFYVQESGSTTVGGSSQMTVGQTTMPVASPNGFPSNLSYVVTVGTEQMLVTAGEGTSTWTVTRGYNSTTPATHNVGDAVTWTYCWYPTAANGACSFDPTNDLGNFIGNYFASTAVLDLGPGQLAGNTRFLKFGFDIPSYASNAMQGTEAIFTLHFRERS